MKQLKTVLPAKVSVWYRDDIGHVLENCCWSRVLDMELHPGNFTDNGGVGAKLFQTCLGKDYDD